ncbi:MAG TPA: DUF951 domain-containing protein [Chloroflexota bacterium]|jgi:hypothetical protein|nr:DUF951 domain-containing protein [Chloroflexota bacterium]
MTVKPPVDFRIGDRLRLRKVHPCGGWTWKVVRLGADIGLVCETCGRRVLLDRMTLERRVKSTIERGTEPAQLTALDSVDLAADKPDELTCKLLGLVQGDILEAGAEIEVQVVYYYTTTSDSGSGRLAAGDQARVAQTPVAEATSVLVEPVDYREFESRFVPGGIRAHGAYTGYAILLRCSDVARSFRKVSVTSEPDST